MNYMHILLKLLIIEDDIFKEDKGEIKALTLKDL
jgi:hypothetical protein